jgi:purine-binding chemotaxis protein CheW
MVGADGLDGRRGEIQADSGREGLLVLAGEHACLIPLAHVIETMRALPVRSLADAPSFVKGLSLVRGSPVPVVDLAAVLGATAASRTPRFVTLRVGGGRASGGRVVALEVDAVREVVGGGAVRAVEMPALLRRASTEVVAAVGAHDAALLVVLDGSRVLTEEAWRRLESAREGVQ